MTARAISLLTVTLALAACGGTPDADPTSEDALAGGGRRLANASVDDVVDAGERMVREQVALLTHAHPSVTTLTKSNVSAFTQDGSTSYLALSELLSEVLKNQASVKPSTLAAQVDGLLRPIAESKASANGVVRCSASSSLGLLAYDACERAERENAFKRAKSATGVDWDTIQSAWSETISGSSLDNWMVLPIAFTSEPSVERVRSSAGIRVALTSSGTKAVDDFLSAGECAPADHRDAFAPIEAALRGSGVKKLYFFGGSPASNVSRNYLIAVDERNQVWGFQSGYSE